MSLDMGANLFFAPLNIRLYAVLWQTQDSIAKRKQVGVFSGVLSNRFGIRVPISAIGFDDEFACRDKEVANVSSDTMLGQEVYSHTAQKLGDDSLNSSASGVAVAPLQVAGVAAVLGVTDSKVGLFGEKFFSAVAADDTFSSANGIGLALSRTVDSCALLGKFLLNRKFLAALLAVLGYTSSLYRVFVGALTRAELVLSLLFVWATSNFLPAVLADRLHSYCSGGVKTSFGAKATLSLEQYGQGNIERLSAMFAYGSFYVGFSLLAIALRAAKMRAGHIRGEFLTAIIAMLDCLWHEKAPCRLSVDTLAEGVQLATRSLKNKYSITRTYRQRYSTLSTFSIAHFGDFNQVTT